MASAADRVAALRDELVACRVAVEPQAPLPSLLGASASLAPSWAAARDGHLKEELRRLKFAVTEAEAQLVFAGRAHKESFTKQPPSSGGAAEGHADKHGRQRGKDKIKELKRHLAREQDTHQSLQHELLQIHDRMQRVHDQCTQDLEEATLRAEKDEVTRQRADLGGALAGLEAASAGSNSVARKAADAAMSLAVHESDLAERQLIEEELRQLEAQRLAIREQATKYRRQEKDESEKCARYESLQDAEAQFGLPRLQLDPVRGVAVLGEPPAPFCHVPVGFGEDGRLLAAEPPEELGLRKEAARAVEEDDLGRLMTLAWDRLHGGGGRASG